MVSGDNKLPDICQREYAQGRGREETREGKARSRRRRDSDCSHGDR